MKLFSTLLLFLVCNVCNSANYYFSSTAGNDSRTSVQAQSQSTPWLSITKLNTVLPGLAFGDSILFKAGETFTGSINATARTGINYGRYGTGADPVLNGYSTLNGSFVNSSGNIWYATLDVPFVQMVVVDGAIKKMGRYPNTGYITYTSHDTLQLRPDPANPENITVVNIAVSGAGISGIPFDPTGAIAVIRKARYYIDGQKITSRVGTKLNLNYNDFGWGYPGGEAQDLDGLFIQGHLSTLDIDGEWYYDATAKRFYIYSTVNPNTRTIKAGGVQIGVQATGATSISISNLKFTGFNSAGVVADYSTGIKVKSSNFTEIGGNGIEGLQGAGGDSLMNNTFKNCLNNAMSFFERNGQYIGHNDIDSSGMFMGMSKSGDAAGNGIHFHGSNILVEYNMVTNSGFNAISSYAGSDWIMQYNFVQNFCVIKDDGGGLYQFGISSVAKSNRIIRNNVVIDGPGNYDGGLGFYASFQTYGQAYGIYMDRYSDNVLITANFVANMSGGGLHNSANCHHNTYTFNTVYNGGAIGALFLDLDGVTVNNLIFTNNTLVAKTTSERLLYFGMFSGITAINHFGTFQDNTYAVPLNPSGVVVTTSDRTGGGETNNDMTLAQWQSTWSKDAGSSISAVTISDTSKFRLDYNGTNSPKTVTLGALYKDVSNVSFSVSRVLPAYTGSILTYYGVLPVIGGGSGGVIITPRGRIKFSLNGSILFGN